MKESSAVEPPQAVRKSRSQQDQEFEERRRIAERLVQDFREAGYSCELADDGHALRRDN
jgi:hypothetical protein